MHGLRHNRWLWWALVPLGFTAWLSPIIAGTRAERRPWVIAGIAYAALWLVGFALTAGPDTDSSLSDLGVIVWFGSWLAPLIHSLLIRKEYERRMAVISDPRFGQRDIALEQQRFSRELIREEPERARSLGIGRPDVEGAFDGGVVDLNHASAEAITRLTGIDAAVARMIVENRTDVGGFRSVEELGALLGVTAQTVDALRENSVFLPL